jgi:phosphoribosyl 1,2-cyclic phosphate phosphodiesterase
VRLTLLGTGTSTGIPQIGCDCAVCRSDDPRDRRSRCAALLEADGMSLLIDTPPELRLQLIGAGVRQIDAVLYTHEHADHVAGIDDLRTLSLRRPAPIPLYGAQHTLEYVRERYRYIFDAAPLPAGTSKPRLTLTAIASGVVSRIGSLAVLPLHFEHGATPVLGFRIGALAYVTDAKRVGAEELSALRGVSVLVLNALWWRPHPTHLSIPEAIEVARSIGAARTILTHLSHETGHAELAARLPAGVEPGYDGLSLEIP